MAERRGRDQNHQLCWTCAHAVADRKHGCSWSRYLIPVRGWNAERHRKGEYMTYCITTCPEYIKETDKIKRETKKELLHTLTEIEQESTITKGKKVNRHWVDEYWAQDGM